MALMKKLLFGGIGLVAIAGIGTGIGVAVNNSITEQGPMSSGGQDSKPDGSKDDLIPPAIDLQKIVNEITPQNIIVKEKANGVEASTPSTTKTQEEIKKSLYAFDVTSSQLDLDEQTQNSIPKEVKVDIELANLIKKSVTLNSGKLDLVLKASLITDKENKEPKTSNIQIEGFKNSPETLTNLLVKESKQTALLDLTKPKKETTQISLTTIENLNTQVKATPGRRSKRDLEETSVQEQKETNLTSLLRTVIADDSNTEAVKTISIQGKVKLEKISKDEANTYFHLVSSTKDRIKLVQTKDSNKEVALVDEIKITNLLVSDIKLVSVGLDKKDQESYLTEFEKEATTKKFKGNKTDGYSVELSSTPDSSDQPKISLKVLPKYIKRIEKKQALLANLEITYGTGNETKTYKTDNETDLLELKNSGLSFEIYSKNLMSTDKVVEADMTIIKEDNKLSSYFVKDGLTTPVKKVSIETMDSGTAKKPIGEFTLVSLKDEKTYKTNFEIGKVTKVMMKEGEAGKHKLDTGASEDWLNENWISFVGYSFMGMKEKDLVLFIPTINLLHINEPTASLELSAAK